MRHFLHSFLVILFLCFPQGSLASWEGSFGTDRLIDFTSGHGKHSRSSDSDEEEPARKRVKLDTLPVEIRETVPGDVWEQIFLGTDRLTCRALSCVSHQFHSLWKKIVETLLPSFRFDHFALWPSSRTEKIVIDDTESKTRFLERIRRNRRTAVSVVGSYKEPNSLDQWLVYDKHACELAPYLYRYQLLVRRVPDHLLIDSRRDIVKSQCKSFFLDPRFGKKAYLFLHGGKLLCCADDNKLYQLEFYTDASGVEKMRRTLVLQTATTEESLIFVPSEQDESTLHYIVRSNGADQCQVGCLEKDDKGIFVAKHLKDLEIEGIQRVACSQRVGNRAILVSDRGGKIDIISCSLDENAEEVLPRFPIENEGLSLTFQSDALELFSFQHGLFLLKRSKCGVRIFSVDGETLASEEVGYCILPETHAIMPLATCGPYIVLFQKVILLHQNGWDRDLGSYVCLFNTLTKKISSKETIDVHADDFFIQQGALCLFRTRAVENIGFTVKRIQLPDHCKELSSDTPRS